MYLLQTIRWTSDLFSHRVWLEETIYITTLRGITLLLSSVVSEGVHLRQTCVKLEPTSRRLWQLIWSESCHDLNSISIGFICYS